MSVSERVWHSLQYSLSRGFSLPQVTLCDLHFSLRYFMNAANGVWKHRRGEARWYMDQDWLSDAGSRRPCQSYQQLETTLWSLDYPRCCYLTNTCLPSFGVGPRKEVTCITIVNDNKWRPGICRKLRLADQKAYVTAGGQQTLIFLCTF